MMLSEITDLLRHLPPSASRDQYTKAVVDENLLGKRTQATRNLTDQRLGELYALAPEVPIFRVLRRLWDLDPAARPLLALLTVLARDPLLRLTSPFILQLEPGQELVRTNMVSGLSRSLGGRLNESTLDKVVRNAGSSWTQSGHLEGRVRKIRRRVDPSPAAVAMSLWLGSLDGQAGEMLLRTFWIGVLDRDEGQILDLALKARQLGLIDARVGGDVVEIHPEGLDPITGKR